MGLMSWLFSKGLAGSISEDLLKKFLGIKNMCPNESNEQILSRVCSYWFTLNEEAIRSEDSEKKISRLDLVKNDIETGKRYGSLFELYLDVLYIEADLTFRDGATFNKAIKVFIDEAKRYGMNFPNPYHQ